MSQATRTASVLSHYGTSRRLPPGTGTRLLVGALAAVLGLGVLAAVVLLLWTVSPYPDSGPGGALHVAADLWLLAHGAQLLRTGTLQGGPSPVDITPVLLCALPLALLGRAAGHVRDEAAASGRPHAGVVALAAPVACGYALVGLAATGYAATGPLRVDVPSALLHLPLFAAGVALLAVWNRDGRPPLSEGLRTFVAALPRCRPPERVLGALTSWRVETAMRGAAVSGAVLLGGGALLAGVGLFWHGGVAQGAFGELTESFSGRLGLLLLCLVLLPNLVLWATAYALGPGFALGTGNAVSVFAVGAAPRLPDFPLLAAAPEGGLGRAAWAVLAVPAAAGLLCGWYVARSAAPVEYEERVGYPGRRASLAAAPETAGGTALASLLAAVLCGAVTGLLAALAGGAMGTGALAEFGPSGVLTGLAAAGWTLSALPTALAVRGWRLRRVRRTQERAAAEVVAAEAEVHNEEWHTARRSRWSAMRRASGGLMADFPARREGDG
ncbi:DUF6350 family protein [Streptomyces sulphureus]|uniref:cell division protein PerM n=1 Tax=Streptomyces sulphureus TaxID=47758 RepID=UPI001FDFBDA0|nr:DUF6350 family protein [Streptomyces sulphureus]